MFSIHSVCMENFRTYSGAHTFNFPSEVGLYFLTGKNELEPKLGSNGAGKSTLLEAVYWCLFGKTTRGLKGGEIITWGQSSASVRVKLTVSNTTFQVQRKQSPNALLIEEGARHSLDEEVWRPIDQAGLQKYLRLNPESFAYSVILPQFGQSFFDLAPSAKLSLFSEIMELEFWLEKSQQAAERMTNLEIQLATTSQEVENTGKLISGVEDSIAIYTEKEVLFDKELKGNLIALSAKVTHIDEEIDWLIPKEALSKQAIQDLKQQQTEWLDRKVRIEKKKSEYSESREKAAVAHATVLAKVESTKQTLKRLTGLKAECPVCLQIVRKEHLLKEKVLLEKEIADLAKQQKILKDDFDAAKAFSTKSQKSVMEADEVLISINEDMIGVEARLSKIQATMGNLKLEKIRAETNLAAEKKRKGLYAEMIESETKNLHTLKSTLKSSIKQRDLIDNEMYSTGYWVNGFKKLRLFIIEEALHSLELEVNNSLATLGLTDWQIEFDVERENKSGGVTKGFVVFIKNATHSEPVKWESWSGGETQRLQLAGGFGLSNLIMLQMGLSNRIEFYDEPSTHLSQEGLLDLAETLHQRALNEGKIIFLIDHHAIEFGDFAETFQVVKTKNGSSFKSC